MRLSIGDMARASGTTVKRLRHYHDKGVFVAAATDPVTGHRWYEPAQIADAVLVARLRRGGVSLAEIGHIVTTHGDGRDAAIRSALTTVEAEVSSARARIAQAATLLQAVPEIAYTVRRAPDHWVLALDGRVSRENCPAWFGRSFTSLLTRAGVPWGPVGALYSPEFFTEDEGAVTAFVPVPAETDGATRLPGGTFAVAVHDGAYEHFEATYAGLGRAVGRDLDSLPEADLREQYLIGPGDSRDPAAWRSEVWWPIRDDSLPPGPPISFEAPTKATRPTHTT